MYKNEIEEILRKRLPIVLDKTLINKNITLSRGLVLVNSIIDSSKINYKGKDPIKVFWKGIVNNNIFTKQIKSSPKEV